jgi:hypothetical protein
MKRYDKVIRHIHNALKQDHLYSDDEIRFMKEQLRMLREANQVEIKKEKNGFGS